MELDEKTFMDIVNSYISSINSSAGTTAGASKKRQCSELFDTIINSRTLFINPSGRIYAFISYSKNQLAFFAESFNLTDHYEKVVLAMKGKDPNPISLQIIPKKYETKDIAEDMIQILKKDLVGDIFYKNELLDLMRKIVKLNELDPASIEANFM
jgi:hypothetical protein